MSLYKWCRFVMLFLDKNHYFLVIEQEWPWTICPLLEQWIYLLVTYLCFNIILFSSLASCFQNEKNPALVIWAFTSLGIMLSILAYLCCMRHKRDIVFLLFSITFQNTEHRVFSSKDKEPFLLVYAQCSHPVEHKIIMLLRSFWNEIILWRHSYLM